MRNNYWMGFGALFFCLSFVFIHPGKAQQAAGEALKQEVERIHDEAMRDMAAMNRVGRALKKELPTLDATVPRRKTLLNVLQQMERAEDDMYNWMKAYNPPADPNTEAAKKYLAGQKRTIEQNYKDIKAAWEAGKRLSGK